MNVSLDGKKIVEWNKKKKKGERNSCKEIKKREQQCGNPDEVKIWDLAAGCNFRWWASRGLKGWFILVPSFFKYDSPGACNKFNRLHVSR